MNQIETLFLKVIEMLKRLNQKIVQQACLLSGFMVPSSETYFIPSFFLLINFFCSDLSFLTAAASSFILLASAFFPASISFFVLGGSGAAFSPASTISLVIFFSCTMISTQATSVALSRFVLMSLRTLRAPAFEALSLNLYSQIALS